MILRPDQGFQDLIGGFHRHATEVRYQMCAMSMASDVAFCINS